MNLFYLQLLTSFIVGGIGATVLSLFAERASKKTAGLIIGLPTTIPIGYFFIAWTVSPSAIKEVAPVSLISLAAALIFLILYLKVARTLKLSKIPLIIASCVIALIGWLMVVLPFGFTHFSNLWLGLAIQLVVCFIGHTILMSNHKVDSQPRSINYTSLQKAVRAVFTGLIIVLTTYLSKTVGAEWGGVLSSFPAVFSSTLVILHVVHDTEFLHHVFYNAALGHLQCTVFIIVASFLFPLLGIIGGLLTTYGVTIAFAYFLYTRVQARL